jgi:hypothetical protein
LVKSDKPFGKILDPLVNQQVASELNEKMISFSSDAATENANSCFGLDEYDS